MKTSVKLLIVIKYTFAVLATILLIPGFGHFIIGRFKKAFILIGVTFGMIMIMSIAIASSSELISVPREYSAMRNYIDAFLLQDRAEITFIYILKAAILSFALADILFSFVSEIRNKEKPNERK
ncbi:MAG: hypothetical protein LBH29_01020 [Elusimicrobiota bacterium]|jgi:hypothetical protein|nr:hypothetical protein [Elusimicrobiota bacterium]